MSTEPTTADAPDAPDEVRVRRSRPERRTRTDVAVGVGMAVVALVVAVVLATTSESSGTTSTPAAAPIPVPPASTAVPAAFTEAWHAPSGATAVPVVVGNAVVTGDGSEVVGRDAVSGTPAWSYRRDLPLCTVGAGFESLGDDSPRVLALYGHDGWCSELTALRADTGVRAATRNPDLRPGARLLGNGTVVAGTGVETIEVMRFDLVRTVEYGKIDTPVQYGLQPRPQCTHATTALAPGRLGVIERCPDDPSDRLTVLDPDETKDAKPVVGSSVLLPGRGATLVAVTDQRAAVVLPDPARLVVLDEAGAEVGSFPVAATAAELAAAADPPGGVPVTGSDARQVSWWTGSSTIVLDPVTLEPVATVPGTLGPGITYGDATLVPVPDGLAVVGRGGAQGNPVVRTIPVARADRAGPVQLATQSEVLVEQRGAEITALTPAR